MIYATFDVSLEKGWPTSPGAFNDSLISRLFRSRCLSPITRAHGFSQKGNNFSWIFIVRAQLHETSWTRLHAHVLLLSAFKLWMHKDSLYVQCANISYAEVYLSEVIGEQKYICIIGVRRSFPVSVISRSNKRTESMEVRVTRRELKFYFLEFYRILSMSLLPCTSMQLRYSEGHFEPPKFLLHLEFHVPVYNVAT